MNIEYSENMDTLIFEKPMETLKSYAWKMMNLKNLRFREYRIWRFVSRNEKIESSRKC